MTSSSLLAIIWFSTNESYLHWVDWEHDCWTVYELWVMLDCTPMLWSDVNWAPLVLLLPSKNIWSLGGATYIKTYESNSGISAAHRTDSIGQADSIKKEQKGAKQWNWNKSRFYFLRLFRIGSKNFPQSNFSSENLSHFQLDAENFPAGSDFFISVSDIGIGAGIDQNPIDWKTKRKKSVIVSAKLWTKNLVIGRILWQGWCGLVEPIFGDFYALNNQRQNSNKK